MHIPDAYLSPVTEATAYTVMAPVWAIAIRKTSQTLTSRQAPLLSIGAAFCFAIQMFNIPAVGGTTAHALGTVLLAILLGPWAALLAMTLTLAVQAMFFGDGGILSLGANSFNMALVAGFCGFGIYRLIAGSAELGSRRALIAAAIGSFSGTLVASASAGFVLGAQPLLAHDAFGHALYFPFGWSVSMPAMIDVHLLTAAPAEAIVTTCALAYLWRNFPQFSGGPVAHRVGATWKLVRVLALVALLTPLGLIAGGSAWGEWEVETLKQMVGYAPAGIVHAGQVIHPLLPEYGFAGFSGKPWEIAGYLVSALFGMAVVAVTVRRIPTRGRCPVLVEPRAPTRQRLDVPSWMMESNQGRPVLGKKERAWLSGALLKMRESVADSMVAERWARQAGPLQSVPPLPKTLLFLSALIAVSLSRSAWSLAAILAATAIMGVLSHLPILKLVYRAGAAALFFGLVLAGPLALQAVTPGRLAFSVAGVGFSQTGLALAGTLLLRLFAGAFLTFTWNLTTRWNDFLRSLRAVRIPGSLISMLSLTYRYLFVILECMAEMIHARRSRQAGGMGKAQARTFAGAGTAILFAKSVAFSEEVHQAMLSRTMTAPQNLDQPKSDRIWAVACGLLVLLTILGGVLHAL